VNPLYYILPILVVITPIIVVHEFGHYLAGRAIGAAIETFSIGFGPTLVSWRDRSGVLWRIAAIPLGGYVKFGGDTNVASVPDRDDLDHMRAEIAAREGEAAVKRYLAFKPIWQRTIVMLAGPAANFVLAVVILSGFYMAFGRIEAPAVVHAIQPNYPAAAAGLRPGDRIVGIDGQSVEGSEQAVQMMRLQPGATMNFLIDRSGRRFHTNMTLASEWATNAMGDRQLIGRIGVVLEPPFVAQLNPLQAVGAAGTETWDITRGTVYILGRIITGHVAADQLQSIVGMARMSGNATKEAVTEAKDQSDAAFRVTITLLTFVCQLSIGVGLFNLAPVPVLDGGHLVFYAYEAIFRRPMPAAAQAVGYRLGVALLLGLMLFANWNGLSHVSLFQPIGR
jgi:regulator of sigma E protease